MRKLYQSLSEKDRRRYAAVEAMKLGHGGISYIAHVLGCDRKTIRSACNEFAFFDENRFYDSRIRRQEEDVNLMRTAIPKFINSF
ncbi:hypothetical protein WDW89_02920 [Deltaproteobacteria bacterium TL4]